MKPWLVRSICRLPLCFFLPVIAAGVAQRVPQSPPVIDESVPPPFNGYPLGPDSQPHASVPAGRTFQFDLKNSRIFPGTVRTITVYVPAEYKADKPACLYVGLDGLGFNVPTVFDNLIAQHAMPVTIAVGLSPGTVDSARPPENPRFDRSFEFDSLSDRLARFLQEEVLPAVEQHRTGGGLPILISDNPNDRAIGGGSTGGIGAFTVAWERPDSFRRVFTAIGTFVGMRGGERYYVLVRKTEPKPIRIFMQDGVHDEWPGGPEMGDWWMSNLTMNRALQFAGYDVRHVWGAGTHNGNQAAAVFPEAMRWLWRDWPSPIEAGQSSNPVLEATLQPHQDWTIAAEGCASVSVLAADAKGKVFFHGGPSGQISDNAAGEKPVRCQSTERDASFAFGPGNTFYSARAEGGLQVFSGASAGKVLARNLRIQAFTVRSNGDIYALTRPMAGTNELWLIASGGKSVRLDQDLQDASGLALSPDGLWLFVDQRHSPDGLSYRILSNGGVDARAPFYDFYVPPSADESGASQIAMDRDGRAWVASPMGVQVFDRNGRVAAILPLPGNVAATSLCFGGPSFNTLYVAGGGRIYKRKLRVAGVPPWNPPIQLPEWSAG